MKKISEIIAMGWKKGWVSFIALAGICFLLMNFSNRAFSTSPVKEVVVDIDKKDLEVFTTYTNFHQFLNDSLKGIVINEVNPWKLSKYLSTIPQFEGVETYMSAKGKLFTNLTLYSPIARVINLEKVYFINKNNQKLPTNSGITALVPLVHYTNQKLSTPKADSITSFVCEYISNNSFFSANTSEILVNKGYSITLIPRLGEFEIEMGWITRENIHKKFKSIRFFYEQVLINKPSDYYSKVSVKFDNQIIATKN